MSSMHRFLNGVLSANPQGTIMVAAERAAEIILGLEMSWEGVQRRVEW
jgi:hypothetical protein